MNTPREMKRSTGRLVLPAIMLAFAMPAFAQSDEAAPQLQPDIAEQEGAVYGRLRFAAGSVTLRRDNQVTTDLVVNDPLTPGDVFATQGDGRAEIQLADGSSVKLDYDTSLVLQSLSDSSNQIENTTILQLGFGSAIIRADNMDSKEKRFQIDTDGASVFLLSDGLFRIDVRQDGTTTVTSRRGVAEVMSQETSSLVRSGERLSVRPDQIPGDARVFNTRLSDDFDAWASERDDSFVRQVRYDEEAPAGLPEPVEPYSTELSYYGRWYNNPSYGWVWRPADLGYDWQPYMNGRWVSCRTGLVWVSYEPWGWAPFHYGRWEFLLGNGWVWIPGHVYSGAYVAWSVSPGYFGWCPLGYYDAPVSFSVNFGYHRNPWMYVHAQNIYTRRVNTVIIRDVTVVREIERRRVVVRGRPVIDPRRVKEAPRMSQELYRVAETHKNVQLDPTPGVRRLPFRENERQKLVNINNRKLRQNREGEVSRGTAVGGGIGGRPVTVMPTDRRVNVPRGRVLRTPAQAPARTPAQAPAQTPARGSRANERHRVLIPAPEDDRPEVAPRKNPSARVPSQPERVIPRIIPRSSATAEPERRQGQAPTRRPSAQPSGGPSSGGPSHGERPRNVQPQKPKQQQQKPDRPKQNNGGDKGGGKKHRS